MRHAVLIALFAAAACGPGEANPDDDDGGVVDGPSGPMSGLVFEFVAPGVGEETDGLTIDRIRGHLRDIRALGDAAPGDERTSQEALELRFETRTSVERVAFMAAPPGRYSAFEFVVDAPQDSGDAWSVEGAIEVDDESYDVRIEDDATIPVGLELDLQLAPGETATITVELDMLYVLGGIDWDSALGEEDAIEIDEDSDEIDDIRSRFATAFSVGGVEIE